MALPKKLKGLNLFGNGDSYQGQVQSVTLPALTRRDGDQHRHSQTDRDNFTGVREFWNDTAGST
ncbi:phage major tail tube protein [Larsenimonas rhizosphaerae]|uniref:Phage major tail tube protein n=1 Tax=Larsenimonas rhizosphaerae TaxID=2944682 RepID=A0AA41ZHU2_9GAMM|nr:phage major tail tube protein [Larsenimonas rhizosphaerae]